MYDLVIIGGGPAGLSAAIYAARFRLKTVVIAREVGGAIANTNLVENWPGFKSLSGFELMEHIKEHVKYLGVGIKQDEVSDIVKKGKKFLIEAKEGRYEGKTVLLATGKRHRKLGVPGEKEFYGKGVGYCAVCDAAFFKDKVVAVVGGSDSAAKEALLLGEYAKKVYIIHRSEGIRAEPITAERVDKNKKIETISNTNVVEIKGKGFVSSVVLDKPHGGSRELGLDGVFIKVGYEPQNELAKRLGVRLDDNGEIIVDCDSGTNIPGIYAAGDVTAGSFKQAITGAAQGVVAANSAYRYLGGRYGV
jgi:thioredoxin reductase (NADPH)